MRAFLALVIIASLAGPVYAQDNHIQRYGEEDKEKTDAEKSADKAATRAYQKSLGNIPDQGPSDPWGGVRSTDAPKTTTAAKPKKTKTGNAESK
jgi:hypothetical protein